MENSGFENNNNKFNEAMKGAFSFILQVYNYNSTVDKVNNEIIPKNKKAMDDAVFFDSEEVRESFNSEMSRPLSNDFKDRILEENKNIINSFPEFKSLGLSNFSHKKPADYYDSVGIKVDDTKSFNTFLSFLNEKKLSAQESVVIYHITMMINDWILQTFSNRHEISGSEKGSDVIDFLAALPSMISKIKSLENKVAFSDSNREKIDFSSAVYVLSKILDFYSQGSLDEFADIFAEQGSLLIEMSNFYQDPDEFINNSIRQIKDLDSLGSYLDLKFKILKEIFSKTFGADKTSRNMKYRTVFEFLYKFENELADSDLVRTAFSSPQEISLVADFKRKVQNLRHRFDSEKL